MDLAKFVSLLDRTALFFVRVNRLAAVDPFEGYYTTRNLSVDAVRFEELPDEWREKTNIRDERTFHVVIEAHKRIRGLAKQQREVMFVNSWHCQEHESAAMWNLYVKSQEGIAVQSTYRRFVDSLANYPDFEVHVGMIRYIDYQRDAIPIGNMLSPCMYKRKSFEHERELRALIWTPQHGRNVIGEPSQNKYADQTGLYVLVDVDRLIERVYIAPTAPRWTLELLTSVVRRYGLHKDVVQSDLAAQPVY